MHKIGSGTASTTQTLNRRHKAHCLLTILSTDRRLYYNINQLQPRRSKAQTKQVIAYDEGSKIARIRTTVRRDVE